MNDRRGELRRRALKSGRIVCGNPPSVFDCVIRSLSERGTRLEVPSQVGIADQLELLEASGKRHPARVVWRTTDALGIEFTDWLNPK
jgi:hypothetical protein